MNLLNNIDCRLWLGIKISLPLEWTSIPSFAAEKSLPDSSKHSITTCAFAPILPYPATKYDAIFTTMINFQDVLKQKNYGNDPLCSHERVYHNAKEIPL